MSMANFFFSLHLLVVVAALCSLVLRSLSIPASSELKLHYLVLVLALFLPFVLLATPTDSSFTPLTKSFTAQTLREYDHQLISQAPVEKIALGKLAPAGISIEWLQMFVVGLMLLSLAASFWVVIKEVRSIRQILRESHVLRRIKKATIVCSESVSVPFSFLTPWHAWVVIPTSFLADSALTRISIYHELQHHRQRDTTWQYAVLALRALAGMNPCISVFMKIISETQELKVDSTLVDEGKVRARDYAQCLLDVATNACVGQKPLVCATGLAFMTDRQTLTRRIENMFQLKKNSQWNVGVLAVALTIFMSTLAFKTGQAIGSPGLTMEEAQTLLANTPSTFPLEMNRDVLHQLNRTLQTVQGREEMRQSLKRLEKYRSLVESKIEEYGVPQELIAVPIVESGYRNLAQNENPTNGAGLWMFIKSTAQAYGLRVWDDVDERLDEAKETDAAMRLLKAEKIRFGKWPLSVLAYNAGDRIVTKGIFKTGSRNAWVLIRHGYQGDKNYLAKLTAAILIMKNTHLLE